MINKISPPPIKILFLSLLFFYFFILYPIQFKSNSQLSLNCHLSLNSLSTLTSAEIHHPVTAASPPPKLTSHPFFFFFLLPLLTVPLSCPMLPTHLAFATNPRWAVVWLVRWLGALLSCFFFFCCGLLLLW